MVSVRAIVVRVGRVPDVHGVTVEFKERGVGHPVPEHVGPVGVGLVPRVAGEAGGELEVAGVGNGIFEIVPCEVGIDLPSQATAAGGGVPEFGLEVVDGLGESDPGRLAGGGVGEVGFSGVEGGEGPEELVVNAHIGGLVGGVVVLVGPDLEEERLGDDGIVG